MANDNEILRRIKEKAGVSMKGIPSWLIDFIRGKGTPEDITYRWYNYFNAGCNKYLGQVPEDFFNMCFST